MVLGQPTKTVAILLAGGSGVRFASPLPKQFHRMSGKPLYLYTLETFLEIEELDLIFLPVPLQWQQQISQEISSLHHASKVRVIAGGASRQHSSYLALLSCPADTTHVIIHDAVRPFITKELIRKNLEAASLYSAVDTCIPSTDTLVHSTEEDWIDQIPKRKEFFRGQTPQSFSYPLILQAHQQAIQDQIRDSSDDCALVLRLGVPIKIILGDEKNIKITTEFDLFLAEQILSCPQLKEQPLPDQSLQGKIFAVTGATGGIGNALCRKLTELGATPLEISQTAKQFKADLTQYVQVQQVFQDICTTYGPIDGLINGIGTFQVKDFFTLSPQEIVSTIHSNLTSILYCCQCVTVRKGGHIINVSSSSYSKGRKESIVYSATKAAIVNFTQGLAEARPDIHVNVVVPQRTNTSLRRSQFPLESISLLLDPEEVAEKIILLLKSSSTGTILEVKKKYGSSSFATP